MSKKKTKLPKRIAGVKVPKALRKGPVGDFLMSKKGQAMIAEGLMALGGALLAARESQPGSKTRQALSDAGDKASDTGHAMGDASDRLGRAFSAATDAFRASLHDKPAKREPKSGEPPALAH